MGSPLGAPRNIMGAFSCIYIQHKSIKNTIILEDGISQEDLKRSPIYEKLKFKDRKKCNRSNE